MLNSEHFRAFFWTFVVFLFENGLHFAWPEHTPPLVLVTVVFYGLSEGPGFGFALGVFAGIFFEMFGLGPLGGQIAAMGFIGFFSGFVSKHIFRESLFSQVVLPLSAAYLMSAWNLLFFTPFWEERGTFFLFVHESFSGADLLLAGLSAPAVFWFLRKASRLGPRSRWT